MKGGGSVYKRQDGRWEGAAYLPTVSGAARRVRVYGKTAKEVNDKLTVKLADAKRGIPVPDRSWTVGAYLDYYMADVAPKVLRPSTVELYETIIRIHIRPALASQSLTGLTVVTLQKIMDGLLARGMSIATAIQVQTVLMAAFTNAMREDVLMRNVARLVKVGTPERKVVQPWTADEVRHFLSFAKNDQHYPALLIAATYGARIGEIMGLRWSDVDWESNVIHIRQQLICVRRELIIGPLKTKKSRRDLPLLPPVRAALLDHRSRMTASGIEPADDLDLIMRTVKGLPMRPNYLSQEVFQRLARRAGLRRVRFHDFRHSAATLLKNLGVPDKDIQAILGHARISTTQEIYQHADVSLQERALSQVERVLLNVGDSTISRQNKPSNDNLAIVSAATQSVNRASSGENNTSIYYFSRLQNETVFTPVARQIQTCTNTHILGALAVSLAVNSRQFGDIHNSLWQWISLRDALSPTPTSFVDRLAATAKEH
ncbi:tyrosine-type recombinase/integrase [Nocardia sp. NPDC003482]